MYQDRLQHWTRIVARYDRIIAELRQAIRDAESWNGLPHNQQHTPLDVEWERVMLARLLAARKEFVERNPRPEE